MISSDCRGVVITGGTGFLGSHLARVLSARGVEVTVLGRAPPSAYDVGDALFRTCDLTIPGALAKALEGVDCDYLFHLAGQNSVPRAVRDPRATLEVNVFAALEVLQWASTHRPVPPRVVLAGSVAGYGVVGASRDLVTEDDPLAPVDPYGSSKVAQEVLGLQWARATDVDVVSLRIFNIIGPGPRADLASSLVKRAVAAERGEVQPVLEHGRLDIVRDFIDYRDAVEALVIAAAHAPEQAVLNVCSGKATAYAEVLSTVQSLARVRLEARQNPDFVRASEAPRIVGDNSRLRALGWVATHGLTEGISALYSYWREGIGAADAAATGRKAT